MPTHRSAPFIYEDNREGGMVSSYTYVYPQHERELTVCMTVLLLIGSRFSVLTNGLYKIYTKCYSLQTRNKKRKTRTLKQSEYKRKHEVPRLEFEYCFLRFVERILQPLSDSSVHIKMSKALLKRGKFPRNTVNLSLRPNSLKYAERLSAVTFLIFACTVGLKESEMLALERARHFI